MWQNANTLVLRGAFWGAYGVFILFALFLCSNAFFKIKGWMEETFKWMNNKWNPDINITSSNIPLAPYPLQPTLLPPPPSLPGSLPLTNTWESMSLVGQVLNTAYKLFLPQAAFKSSRASMSFQSSFIAQIHSSHLSIKSCHLSSPILKSLHHLNYCLCLLPSP